jgi:hypothetical protein
MQRETPKWGALSCTAYEIDRWLTIVHPTKRSRVDALTIPPFDLSSKRRKCCRAPVARRSIETTTKTASPLLRLPREIQDLIYHQALTGLQITIPHGQTETSATYNCTTTTKTTKTVTSFPDWFKTDTLINLEASEQFYHWATFVVDFASHHIDADYRVWAGDSFGRSNRDRCTTDRARYIEVKNLELAFGTARGMSYEDSRHSEAWTLADIFQNNYVLRDLTIHTSLETLEPCTSRRALRLLFLKFLNKGLSRLRLGVEISVTGFEGYADSLQVICDVLKEEVKGVGGECMDEARYEWREVVQSIDDAGKIGCGRIVKYNLAFEVIAAGYKTWLETKKKAPVGSSV